jgi:hypothetical protein
MKGAWCAYYLQKDSVHWTFGDVIAVAAICFKGLVELIAHIIGGISVRLDSRYDVWDSVRINCLLNK